jgi:hypothetical protein
MKIIKNIILQPISFYKRRKITNVINNSKGNRIFIFDIDNTIADTLPSLEIKHWKNESDRVQTLAIFVKMHRLLNILYLNKRNTIYFLSARSYFSFKSTFNWLSNMELPVEKDKIFITRTAEEKKKIFKQLKLDKLNIYYFDDLAYLESNNNIVFYTDLIEYFRNLAKKNKIKYYGLQELTKFISKTKN